MSRQLTRRSAFSLLLCPVALLCIIALTGHARAQHAMDTATPTATLPSDPTTDPTSAILPVGTLPPGPTTRATPVRTLPPGPVRNQTFFHPTLAIFTRQGRRWRHTRKVGVNSPAKFDFCYTANHVNKPAAQLTLQRGYARIVESVVARYAMHKVSVKGHRYCFSKTLRFSNRTFLGRNTAGFIVVDGRAPVAPFPLTFRVVPGRQRGAGKG